MGGSKTNQGEREISSLFLTCSKQKDRGNVCESPKNYRSRSHVCTALCWITVVCSKHVWCGRIQQELLVLHPRRETTATATTATTDSFQKLSTRHLRLAHDVQAERAAAIHKVVHQLPAHLANRMHGR